MSRIQPWATMLDSAGELEETVRCTPKLFCPGDEEARAFVPRFWCRFGWVAPRGISSQLFELDSSWTVVDAGPVGTTGRTPAAGPPLVPGYVRARYCAGQRAVDQGPCPATPPSPILPQMQHSRKLNHRVWFRSKDQLWPLWSRNLGQVTSSL